MKIIVPMAGRGTRLRPHTLITPKPLLPVAGKPIVHRLVEDIVALYDGKVEEIAFIVGDFGAEAEQQLVAIAEKLGAKGSIYHQDKPLGTAHAIWQARESMDDEIIIAFADTLFRATFTLDRSKDGVIWVNKVEDPRPYGVVTLDGEGVITEFVEKPQEFVSDLAIIGIYYVKDGPALRDEIQYLLDNDIRDKGEYQLTNALENLKQKGARFGAGEVELWMDCGNKDAVLDTDRKVLAYDHEHGKNLISADVTSENSVIIPPCYIGKGVTLRNSVVGPFVSLYDGATVENSVVSRSSVREKSVIRNAVLAEAMIGASAGVERTPDGPSLGDFGRI